MSQRFVHIEHDVLEQDLVDYDVHNTDDDVSDCTQQFFLGHRA